MDVPGGTPAGFTPNKFPRAKFNSRSLLFLRRASFQHQSRNRRDRRQRFAAKSQRRNAQQIIRRAQLASRVPLECQQRVVMRHAAAVINHAYQPLAARFYFNANRLRAPASMRVFQQLFHDRSRPLDHFSRGDLIRHSFRQYSEFCSSELFFILTLNFTHSSNQSPNHSIAWRPQPKATPPSNPARPSSSEMRSPREWIFLRPAASPRDPNPARCRHAAACHSSAHPEKIQSVGTPAHRSIQSRGIIEIEYPVRESLCSPIPTRRHSAPDHNPSSESRRAVLGLRASSKSSSIIPVNGCCALSQLFSFSLHSNSGKPVSHRNSQRSFGISESFSARCSRNCPAISAADSVPGICSFAATATIKSPAFAPTSVASFCKFSAPNSFPVRK